jgi:MscS family membrane protein
MSTLAQAPQAVSKQAATTRPVVTHWYELEYLNNAVWRWAALLGVLILTFAIGRIVSYFLNRHGRWLAERRRFGVLGQILCSLANPAALLIFGGGLYLAGQIMKLDIPKVGDLSWFWLGVCKAIAVLAGGWAVYRLVDVLETVLRRWTAKTRTQLDDQLVPMVRKALRAFIIIIVALVIAQNVFEWNIGALLAGLGLGGLAFALAAQDTLKNLFGSITIFADRPFALGERVKIRDHDGFVEEVGFRSTRIRTLTGHLVTIPNSVVTDSPVENIGRRPYIRRLLNVTVTYDTPPEKMVRAVEILKEMLEARKEHFPPDMPGKVYFDEFNAASLNIVVYYWFTPPDWWEYLTFTHDFNMELLRRFNEEGIEFAFPTQTLYLKPESPI